MAGTQSPEVKVVEHVAFTLDRLADSIGELPVRVHVQENGPGVPRGPQPMTPSCAGRRSVSSACGSPSLTAAAVLDLGNAVYSAMLTLLAQAFGEEQRSEQVRLVGAGVEMMEASAACANALSRMPAEASRPSVNAGLTFAVPRNIGARPRASRVHFLERLALLRAGADRVLAGETRTKTLRRMDRAQNLLNGVEPRA